MVIVVSVVLAGCSGFVTDSSDDREQYTVDDELDPRIESGSADDESSAHLAPGVTTDGVENESVLLDYHFTALERASENGTYTAVEHRTVDENRTLAREHDRRTVVAYPTGWHDTVTTTTYETDPLETVTYDSWVTESEILHREDRPDESPHYDAGEPFDRPGHPNQLEHQIETAVSMVTVDEPVTVERYRHDETTRYELTRESESEHHSSGTSTVTVQVREDGFIERVDETITREPSEDDTEEPLVRQSSIEFEINVNDTLERPDWYDDAREATDDE